MSDIHCRTGQYSPAQQTPCEVAAADHGCNHGAAAEGERLDSTQAAPFGWVGVRVDAPMLRHRDARDGGADRQSGDPFWPE